MFMFETGSWGILCLQATGHEQGHDDQLFLSPYTYKTLYDLL